ncbi:MAG TPA: hypothetical protein VMU95_03435 [Trebonia sp.]|nr:hypothetical protein [Trebonia sp.]
MRGLFPRAARAGLGAAAAVALAGCAASGPVEPTAPAAAVTAPLATSMTTAQGQAWAIVAMGGPAADEDLFWELLTRLPGSSQWKLVTPPGVADNGGLVAAGSAGPLTVAFEPSQDLVFSPLAQTSNGGRTWGTGLLNAAVAAVPDALAADPGGRLALLNDGAIDQATTSQAASGHWAQLAAPGAVAASPAGRACQAARPTAVAYTPAGTPLAAASCARPGIAGIFAREAGTWRPSGPAVPGGQPVQVLRLSQTPTGDIAVLWEGASAGASVAAAWTGDGTRWTVSPVLPLHGGGVTASGTGPGGALWVLLSGDRARALAGPGGPWRELPEPPRGTATLAVGPAGRYQALAVVGAHLVVYRLTSAGA